MIGGYDMLRKINYQKKKEELLEKHGAYCAYCQAPLFPNNMCIDHYLSVKLYPEKANDDDNLILCCRECNIRKSSRLPYDENGNIVILNPYTEEYKKMIRGSKNGRLVLNLDNATPAMLNTVKELALDKRANTYIYHDTGSAKVSDDFDIKKETKVETERLNRINKVRIRNFKSIEDIELSLNRINVLIGGNNAGKSSILQAVQFAIGVAQTAGRHEKDVYAKPKIVFCDDSSAFLYSPTVDMNALIRKKEGSEKNGIDITFSTKAVKTDIVLYHKLNNSFEAKISNTSLFNAIKSNTSPYCVYITGLSGLPLTEEFTAKAKVLKSATRGDSNLYLRNILWLLHEDEDKSKWENFLKKFKLFYPEYTIDICFSPEIDEMINVFAIVKKDRQANLKIPLDMLGTGALQVIQILSYISYFTPSILILDEPDTHLHPKNQKLLFEVLKKYSDKEGTQILIATHSKHIMDSAQNAKATSVFWISRGETAQELKPGYNTEVISVLQEIGEATLAELKKSDLKYIIFTEDENVDKTKYLKTILEASGVNERSVAIVPYYGCSKADNIITAYKLLENFNSDLKIIVHRDRDYLNDEQKKAYKNSLNKKGIKGKISVWFTPGSDLEAIFVDAAHIKACYPELRDSIIENAIKEAYAEAKAASVKRLVEHQKVTERENNKKMKSTENSHKTEADLESLYDSDPSYYCYGKKTFSALKAIIQKSLHENPKLIEPTKFIEQKELKALFKDTSKTKK